MYIYPWLYPFAGGHNGVVWGGLGWGGVGSGWWPSLHMQYIIYTLYDIICICNHRVVTLKKTGTVNNKLQGLWSAEVMVCCQRLLQESWEVGKAFAKCLRYLFQLRNSRGFSWLGLMNVVRSRGHWITNFLFFGHQTIQIYGNFEGFPPIVLHCLVGNIMTPDLFQLQNSRFRLTQKGLIRCDSMNSGIQVQELFLWKVQPSGFLCWSTPAIFVNSQYGDQEVEDSWRHHGGGNGMVFVDSKGAKEKVNKKP